MTKALLGAHLAPTELALLDEVRRLRARVVELEAALATRSVVACGCGAGAPVTSDRDVAAPTGG